MAKKVYNLIPLFLLGIYYFIKPLISFKYEIIYLVFTIFISVYIISKKKHLKNSNLILLTIGIIATISIFLVYY
jgi:hypothetical protein